MKNRVWKYYGFLVLSGVASLITSVIGILMVTFGYPKSAHTAVALLFCVLPCLSLGVFGLALANRRLGNVVAWMLYAATLATVFYVNWQQCIGGKCNTSNPWIVFISTSVSVPHLWFLFVAALSLQLAHTRTRPLGSDDLPTLPD